MTQETVSVSAESHWREDEGEAKNECNRILDMKVDSEVVRRRHDGWELVSGTYSDYDIKHDAAEDLYRCLRSKDLVFEL